MVVENILSAFVERMNVHETTDLALASDDAPVIDYFLELPSTNRYLMEQYRHSGQTDAICACVADVQTAGVGRQGRSWQSPGQSITFSIRVPLDTELGQLGGLSLAIGTAVIGCLQTIVRQQLTLKWPNDVLAGDRKLSGILIESPGNAGGTTVLIIGIGVNFSGFDELTQLLDRPLVTLEQLLREDELNHLTANDEQLDAVTFEPMPLPPREKLIGSLIADVLHTIDEFQNSGWQKFAPRFAALDALHGHTVSVSHGTQRVVGIARGVADNGNLLVEIAGSVRSFAAGEVSLSHPMA